ncbi:hypothetical protein R3I93_005490 [Phoxinus phoxinus]|uniref:Uncharacterized protein n=1 Tax=Phoxinus phoxinus TaxID=58324 RepID=A0AAN9DB68_9TELE
MPYIQASHRSSSDSCKAPRLSWDTENGENQSIKADRDKEEPGKHIIMAASARPCRNSRKTLRKVQDVKLHIPLPPAMSDRQRRRLPSVLWERQEDMRVPMAVTEEARALGAKTALCQ